jgi:hypothetical protein
MVLCGWQDYDCNTCPYCEDDQCKYSEDLIPFVKWMYALIKERCRHNPIGWGSRYTFYHGKKKFMIG